MNYFLYMVGNFFIGACILAAIDDENQSLFNWYISCPKEIAWGAQPVVLTFWPVVLWFWFKRNTKENTALEPTRDSGAKT